MDILVDSQNHLSLITGMNVSLSVYLVCHYAPRYYHCKTVFAKLIMALLASFLALAMSMLYFGFDNNSFCKAGMLTCILYGVFYAICATCYFYRLYILSGKRSLHKYLAPFLVGVCFIYMMVYCGFSDHVRIAPYLCVPITDFTLSVSNSLVSAAASVYILIGHIVELYIHYKKVKSTNLRGIFKYQREVITYVLPAIMLYTTLFTVNPFLDPPVMIAVVMITPMIEISLIIWSMDISISKEKGAGDSGTGGGSNHTSSSGNKLQKSLETP